MSDVSQAARVAELERAVKVLVAEVKAMIAVNNAAHDEAVTIGEFSVLCDRRVAAERVRNADPIAGPLVRAQ